MNNRKGTVRALIRDRSDHFLKVFRVLAIDKEGDIFIRSQRIHPLPGVFTTTKEILRTEPEDFSDRFVQVSTPTIARFDHSKFFASRNRINDWAFHHSPIPDDFRPVCEN